MNHSTLRHPTLATVSLALVLISLAACKPSEVALPNTVAYSLSTEFTKADAAACAALFAPDGVLMPPATPSISDPQAIRAYFDREVAKELTFTMTHDMNLVRGDIGVLSGTYSVRNVRTGREVETGKHIGVWHKIDGEWKIARWAWSPDRPQPRAAIEPAEE